MAGVVASRSGCGRPDAGAVRDSDTSRQFRAPLGALIARSLLSADLVPAPPHGFQNVRFRSQFANQTIVETVTLDREAGEWRVVGIVAG